MAADFYERDGLSIARLEAHRGAGRDVEDVAIGLQPVEFELGVGFDEVIVGADLAIVNSSLCGTIIAGSLPGWVYLPYSKP